MFKKFSLIVINGRRAAFVSFLCLMLGVGISLFLMFLPSGTLAGNIPIYCVDSAEKKIAITFDCAWEDFDTDEILRVLKENEAKATFFVTGDYVRRCAESVKKFYEAGHDIGNHSDNHPHPNSLSAKELTEDTQKCAEEIKKLGIEEKKLYRAPYGEYNDSAVSTINKAGYSFIQWDVDSLDYTGLSVGEIKDRVTKRVKSGSIVLFHTGVENTAEALGQILSQLKDEGYSFAGVDELICKEDFFIDHTGKQIKK